jgi:hypothetical protein
MDKNYLGENLIFIISQPRSGSTLLQRVLSGHPDIQTSAETWLLLHPVYALRNTGIETEYDARFAVQGVTEFITHYADGMAVYDDAIRQWAGIIYNNVLEKNHKTFFLDKTPRYFFIIPELYRLFPKAKFIFLLRNPLAILSSILSTYVKGEWPVLSFFRPDLLRAPQLILDGIELFKNDAIVIRYEDFVSSPADNTATLCRQLGIGYHEGMLDYSRTPAPKGALNDPVGIHRHTSPSKDNLDKWKQLFDSAQTRHFAASYIQSLGNDVLEKLGYSAELTAALEKGGAGAPPAAGLYPWEIAIRPKKEWTLREQYLSDKYFYIMKKGYIGGTLRSVKRITRQAAKAVAEQLRARNKK